MSIQTYPEFGCNLSDKLELLGKKDALEFSRCYVDRIPTRLLVLREFLKGLGLKEILTCERDGLSKLGKWFGEFAAADSVPVEADLIHLYGDSYTRGPNRQLGRQGASLCLDMGVFLGECLRGKVAGAHWGTFFADRRHINHNQPVLFNGDETVFFAPLELVPLFAFAYVQDNARLPDLADRFDYFLSMMNKEIQ